MPGFYNFLVYEKQQGIPDSGERKSRSLARSELPAEN